jgi:hypothetical protein
MDTQEIEHRPRVYKIYWVQHTKVYDRSDWARKAYQDRARCHGPRSGPWSWGAWWARRSRSLPSRSRLADAGMPIVQVSKPCLVSAQSRRLIGSACRRFCPKLDVRRTNRPRPRPHPRLSRTRNPHAVCEGELTYIEVEGERMRCSLGMIQRMNTKMNDPDDLCHGSRLSRIAFKSREVKLPRGKRGNSYLIARLAQVTSQKINPNLIKYEDSWRGKKALWSYGTKRYLQITRKVQLITRHHGASTGNPFNSF